MSELFPPIHENRHFYLDVGDQHKIYVEECGNPDGIPVIFLHGGPGAGCGEIHRQFFDPEKYWIILFDQRGCGRSTPHASIDNNTTQDLVSDIEKIRNELDIDKWVVSGGSWGSTLSLVYAQTHTENVLGLILRGIFFSTPKEVSWFYQEGASQIFPDYWEDFIEPIPEEERDNFLLAYHKRLNSDNEIKKMGAARAWSLWEARTATLQPSPSGIKKYHDPKNAMGISRIETHYFMNNGFLEENQILNNMNKLQDLPGFIVQGRYDMICPMKQAYDLHKAWPRSEFFVVQSAGHSAGEQGITAALIKAGNDMMKLLQN
ncbi:UNVERIFIED_CONTAM: hypothetical protein GTU68_030286 [Idotea baltica]|nr:hypothetical protein [Idotea baltica]